MVFFGLTANLSLALVLSFFTLQACSSTGKSPNGATNGVTSEGIILPDREVSSVSELYVVGIAREILYASKVGDLQAIQNIFRKATSDEIRQDVVPIGSVLNYQDEDGMTAIMYASRRGYDRIIDYLLDRHRARGNKLKFDFEIPVPSLPFFMAGDKDKTSTLTNNNGDTALHLAVREGHSKVVSLLLRDFKEFFKRENSRPRYYSMNGINIQNNIGRTPLIEAVILGNIDIIEKISSWADVNIQDEDGMTAIMYAVQRPDAIPQIRAETIKIIELIKNRRAIGRDRPARSIIKLDLRNKEGKTVIDIASEKHKDILEALPQKEVY